MPKKGKKESLSDLKEEIVESAEAVSGIIEKQAEAVAGDVVQAVESVKKNRRFASLLKKIPTGRFAILALVLVAVGGIGASGYFYYQYSKTQQVLGSAQNQFSEVKSIVESVGKLMDLPGEEPTVATVSDVEKLRAQPFFNRAENGDKVLIYQSTRKAILYRPAINKIIDVATVNLDSPQATTPTTAGTSPTPTPEEEDSGPVEVVIWNGTTTTGLTVRGEEEIGGIENVDVIERDNAKKRSYEKNIIVKLGNVPDSKIQEIADALNATIEDLPSGEDAPEADVLIILGSDFISEAPSEE